MVRNDIVSGLKNAVQRGYSLDQAKQSYINAGYNQMEVEEAVKYLTSGLTQMPQPMQPQTQKPQTTPQNPSQAQSPYYQPQFQQYPVYNQQVQQSSSQSQPLEKKKKPWKVIILVIVLVILLALLGVSLLYRDSLVTYIQGLLG